MRVWGVLLASWVPASAWAGDKDGDGNKNKTDQCVEEAEDTDQFQDEDGCPDPDNDGDGIEDANDQCPSDAEDADTFQDADGCPDPDNDQDGVTDADDKCANEAEDEADGDGCAAVTLKLLSETGYMAAIGTLSSALLAAVGQEDQGCAAAVSASREWLASNDPVALAAEWDDRLKRAPEGFDTKGPVDLLGKKGEVYKPLRQALGGFCADDSGWKAVEAQVDAVFARLPVPEPPPKKRR